MIFTGKKIVTTLYTEDGGELVVRVHAGHQHKGSSEGGTRVWIDENPNDLDSPVCTNVECHYTYVGELPDGHTPGEGCTACGKGSLEPKNPLVVG